jgi:hypothetical protein
MGQLCCQLAVVGQQQQPLGFEVEPADRIDVLLDAAEQVHDRRTLMRVRSSGDIAAWLIQQDIPMPLRQLDAPAVDPDVVLRRVRLRPQLAECRAVDGDPSLADQLFRGTAGGDAGLRQNLL